MGKISKLNSGFISKLEFETSKAALQNTIGELKETIRRSSNEIFMLKEENDRLKILVVDLEKRLVGSGHPLLPDKATLGDWH